MPIYVQPWWLQIHRDSWLNRIVLLKWDIPYLEVYGFKEMSPEVPHQRCLF